MLGATKARPNISPAFKPAPMPRLAEGKALAPHVSAMMDISDGLLLDCWRMAWVSGVTLAIDSAAVRSHRAPRALPNACAGAMITNCCSPAPEGAALPVPAIRIGAGGVPRRRGPRCCLDEAPLADPANLGYRHG